jgi:hypothetical protein
MLYHDPFQNIFKIKAHCAFALHTYNTLVERFTNTLPLTLSVPDIPLPLVQYRKTTWHQKG